jgi:hypothetical protein
MDGIAGLPNIIDADFDVVVEGMTDDVDLDAPKLTSDGTIEVSLPDGSVVIDLNPQFRRDALASEGHDENLADKIDQTELARICGDLCNGIDSDDRSRSQWLEARARGIDLLGLKLDDPKADFASGAPLEGMSTVRDPILLEACIRFMSNASAELLPASGPVKVRNDGAGNAQNDQQAEMLEKDLNAYLTTTASDYYPDTRRMLFSTGFGGSGFKKIYHSPLRNRPVSEYVDAKDLIVSNAAVDLTSAARVTQVVRMKQSDMVRMQILGVYRHVDLFPQANAGDAVDRKLASIQGISPNSQSRPEDQDYELWECYCELDIRGYEHTKDGAPTGLPLPYRVTIDKASQQILEIRRNWDEDDPEYQARKTFVEFSYIKAFGFYGIGLLHILGNIATALTAGTREVLDAGMLANFPGFLYIQNGSSRQMTNHFRVPPGGGAPLQGNGNMAIKDMVMPLPYREPGPAFMTFLGSLRETGQRVGNMAEIGVGEGKQNAPVGTTLALIEQAMKVEGAVHKGLHASQSEELRLLKKCFQEDPESLWRHSKRKTTKWNADQLIAALNNVDLVPQADPNTPSHMHRVMKWTAVKQLQSANPALYDAKKVDENILKAIGIDNPEELFAPPQQPGAPPPDPRLLVAGINAQIQQAKIAADAQNKDKALQTQLAIAAMRNQPQPAQGAPDQPAVDPKFAVAALNAQVRERELAANAIEKEKDRDVKLMIEKLKLASSLTVHPESEDMVQSLLATEQIPLYEDI